MRILFTILFLFLVGTASAQRVQYSPLESGYKKWASYDIIGRIGNHTLIFIKGPEGAKIAVYDDAMRVLNQVPANSLGATEIETKFFAYPDHFVAVFQYRNDSVYYCSAFRGDADGHVVAGPVILDSIEFRNPALPKDVTSRRYRSKEFPFHIVLRSDDLQRYMLVKSSMKENGAYMMTTRLFDKDLVPVETSTLSFLPPNDLVSFSEFILDNDGDLVFIASGRPDDGEKVKQAWLIRKPKGRDSLHNIVLTRSDTKFDDLKITVDEPNHRYILNSFYYAPGDKSLTGLCTMIWDKSSDTITRFTLIPLSQSIRTEAVTDFSDPAKILDHFYLRQVIIKGNGDFLVLAELCHETNVNAVSIWKRFDFIRGNLNQVVTPPQGLLSFESKWNSGFWAASPITPIPRDAYLGFNRNTENILAFDLDREGKAREIKVIHKIGFSPLTLAPLSFQTFATSRGLHLIYNEPVRGNYLPVVTTLHADGTIDQDQVLHDLDFSRLFYPQYGRQTGPNTFILPFTQKGSFGFARVDF